MKKNVLHFLLLVILFGGCSKTQLTSDAEITNSSIKELLSTIQSVAIRENPQLQSRITSLLLRVDTTTAQYGDYHNNQYVSLTVNAPAETAGIKVSSSTTSQKPSNSLTKKKFTTTQEKLLIYLHKGKITNVEILQIQTNDGESSLKKHLSDIVNFKKSEFSGDVIYRTLGGKFLYTVQYSKNAYGYSNIRAKKDTKESSTKAHSTIKTDAMACIDWYLVTTITYVDGTQSVSEEYVGTTCNSCESDPYGNQSLCDPISGGGGGDTWPTEFTTTPNLKLCGQYSWTLSGGLPDGAKNTVISNLAATFSPNNNPSIILSARFGDACVTIPNHCSTNENVLSQMFNRAFNKAVSSVESRIGQVNGPNPIPPGDIFVYDELKKEIQKEVAEECPGSVFNNGGCSSNIARNKPVFCPNT